MDRYLLGCTVVVLGLLGQTLALDGTVKLMIEQDKKFLSIFKSHLENIQILDDLGKEGDWYTVFAPIDEAFQGLDVNLERMNFNDKLQLMKYHMVYSTEENTRINIANDQSIGTDAINQPVVWFNSYRGIKTVNGARVLSQVDADNGRIYLIDRVLYPVGTKDNTYAYMVHNPHKARGFEELIIAAELQGLINNFRGTILIPNNMALTTGGGLDTTVRESLKADMPLLRKVIKGHIIEKEMWPLSRLEYFSNIEVYDDRFDGLDDDQGAATMDEGTRCTVAKRGTDRYIMCGMVSARIVESDIITNSGIVHIVDKLLNYIHSNAHEQIAMDGSLSDFQQIMRQQTPEEEVYNYLNQDNGPDVTVIVPMNVGFSLLNQETLDTLREDRPFLSKILNLHIIPNEVVMVKDIPIGGEVAFAKRSRAPLDPSKPDGPSMILRFYRDENDTYVEGGHIMAKIVRLDYGVTNGVLHYIDRVLGAPYETIQEAVFKHPNLTMLQVYLRQVNIWPLLAVADMKMTLFAPTNEVLWKIRRDDPEFFHMPWALKYVLGRHFLNDTIFFFDEIADASEISVKANNTNKIILQNNGGYQYRIKYSQYSIIYTAAVVKADIGCLNGALHIINDWIFVPGAEGDIIGGADTCRQTCVVTLLPLLLLVYQILQYILR